MKMLLVCLLLVPCFAHALVVNCYEKRHSDDGLNLSYVFTKTTMRMLYQKFSFGQVLESGRLARKNIGNRIESNTCLGKKGNFGWFSVCTGDEIRTRDSDFGRLVTLTGVEQGQSGFELHCEEKVMSLLN